MHETAAKSPNSLPKLSPRPLTPEAARPFSGQKESAPGGSHHAQAEPLVVKSISGGFLAQTADRQPSTAPARSQDRARPHRCRMERARVRLESRQTREIKRHCLCPRRPDRRRRRRPDEPRRFRQHRRYPSAPPARGHRRRIGRVFPFPRWSGRSRRNGATAFIQPGGSVKDCRRDRRRRSARSGHGIHRDPALPPLAQAKID